MSAARIADLERDLAAALSALDALTKRVEVLEAQVRASRDVAAPDARRTGALVIDENKMRDVPAMAFFGVAAGTDAVHFARGSGVTTHRGSVGPFRGCDLDGVWCQEIPRAPRKVPTANHIDAQREGRAYTHHANGWTLTAWWDRSGDKRMGSCAVFLCEGTYTSAEMMRGARRHFPREIARMEARYRIVDVTGGGE